MKKRACNGPSLRRGKLIKPTSKSSRYGGAHSSHVKCDTHIAAQGAIQAKHPMHKMAVSRKHKMKNAYKHSNYMLYAINEIL
jgi:hypothetical protein